MKDELLTSLAIRRMREGGEQVVQQAMMYIERIGSVYWRCRILIELGRLLPLDAGLALDAEVAVLARKIPDDVQYEVSEAVLDVAIRVGERHREDLARLALEYHDLEPHPRWIARILRQAADLLQGKERIECLMRAAKLMIELDDTSDMVVEDLFACLRSVGLAHDSAALERVLGWIESSPQRSPAAYAALVAAGPKEERRRLFMLLTQRFEGMTRGACYKAIRELASLDWDDELKTFAPSLYDAMMRPWRAWN